MFSCSSVSLWASNKRRVYVKKKSKSCSDCFNDLCCGATFRTNSARLLQTRHKVSHFSLWPLNATSAALPSCSASPAVFGVWRRRLFVSKTKRESLSGESDLHTSRGSGKWKIGPTGENRWRTRSVFSTCSHLLDLFFNTWSPISYGLIKMKD